MVNEAIIDSLVLHKIGNKAEEEGVKLSKDKVNLDDEIKSLLTTYFITPFRTEEYFNLFHDSDINLNEVYAYVSEIFNNPETLLEQSENLAKHLYAQSEHPRIKPGEFYVCYFNDCIVDGEPVEAIGLFKSENKETYIKVYPTSNNYIIEGDEGISINKLDKGCMIFNTEKENGYLVAIADGLGKGADANYWCDGFLGLRSRKDSYSHTQNVMNTCKTFVTEHLPVDFDANKADQIDLLNKSMEYFNKNEVFEQEKFEQEVFCQPEIIESYRNFEKQYVEEHDIPKEVTFEIAPQAVKKQAKNFKSILKLDKNFHIYIHGDKSLIERGEEDGRKFYKIYFEEEN